MSQLKRVIGFRDERIEAVLWAIILVPFFEPPCIAILEKLQGESLLSACGLIFAVARIVVSAAVIAKALFKGLGFDKKGCIFLAFCALLLVMSFLNGSIGKTSLLTAFEYAGFWILCWVMCSKSARRFVTAVTLIMMVMFVVSVLNVALIADIIPGNELQVVYFFGGKNSFFWASLFGCILLSRFYYCSRNPLAFAGVLCTMVLSCVIASYIDSMNTLICLCLLTVVFTLSVFAGLPSVLFNGRVYLIVLSAVLLGIVVLNIQTGVASEIVGHLGRSATFSGRDVLWQQALDYIKANPISGFSCEITYNLRGGYVTNHAHCFFLDLAAKYGLITLCVFTLFLRLALKDCDGEDTQGYSSFLAYCVFIVLFHSIFDNAEMYYIIALTMLCSCSNGAESKKGIKRVSRVFLAR